MAKIKKGSRRIVLLAAFVSVMSGAGGLLGAVTGAVFILLMRSVYNMSSGIGEFMFATIAMGAAIFCLLSLMLTVERPQRFFVRNAAPATAPVPVAVVPTADGK